MVASGQILELTSPAKINLSLAIMGKQPDGFHALHSVVAQTVFGDAIRLEWNPDASGPDQIIASNADLPEKENTIWHALGLFRKKAGIESGGFTVRLEKRIPMGAGLGGGSSNAVTVLRGLRQLFQEQVSGLDWDAMAAEIGSDCPLFLRDDPVIIEGRGEKISALPDALCDRLRGKPVFLFKPGFSINTAEAYGRLAKGKFYQAPEKPLSLLDEWQSGDEWLPSNCNDFERLLGDWMPGLCIVLQRLRNRHGMDARLSGSGSACFVFPSGPLFAIKTLQQELADAWGNAYWIQETCLK